MKVPTIHMNGTSKESLLEQWEEAYNALRVALEKLAQAAPNARDYYPQDSNPMVSTSFYAARDEHQARMAKVQSVMADLQQLCEEVSFK